MEVKNAQGPFLTNSEVLNLLSEMKHIPKSNIGENNHPLATIVYEVNKALQHTPASQQSTNQIESLCKSLKEFELTAAEILQILNLRPTTPIEIQLIVEECEERLSEEKVEELLETIAKNLPLKQSKAESTSMDIT